MAAIPLSATAPFRQQYLIILLPNMHRPRPQQQPNSSAPQPTGFPLQPDPGLPPPASYTTERPSANGTSAAGMAPSPPPMQRGKQTLLRPEAPAPGAADTVPLLVKDLHGATREMQVSASTNVDDIQRMLLEESGQSAGDYRLSFGDVEIAPGIPLSDTTVIPAYATASSLLQVIGNGRLEPAQTNQAIDSVMGVVRSLSNGNKDVDVLCAAAVTSLGEPVSGRAPGPDAVAAGADAGSVQWGETPTPAALVRGLSNRLPTLFTPGASEDFSTSFLADYGVGLGDIGGNFDDPAPPPGPPVAQPALTDIAKARRMKQAKAEGGDPLVQSGSLAALSVPSLDMATTMAAAAASGYGNGDAVVGTSGDGTWMDDVKSTWEAGLVRGSGLLDKTQTGKELGESYKNFDVQMKQEDTDMSEKSAASGAAGSAAGDAAGAPSAMDVDEPKQQPPKLQRAAPVRLPQGQPPQPAPGGTSKAAASSSAAPTGAPSTTTASSASGTTSPVTSRESSGPPSLTRKPTLIAPSPPSLMPRVPVVSKPAQPLRRGRRLKNPELTPEQRAQHRKEQKRASARQSRIRKKSMEDDYQQKVRALLGENNQLKMQVADLSHRLECLQGLLTVSLRPVDGANPGQTQAPPFAFRQPAQAAGSQPMSQTQPPAQTGANLPPGLPPGPSTSQAQFRR